MAKRGSGKTTRMLADAEKQSRNGRAVYVIAATDHHAKMLRSLLPVDSAVKVETPESPGNFDWQQMRLRGAHPNCVVLVDHYAIEHHFSQMLEMLHKYDS